MEQRALLEHDYASHEDLSMVRSWIDTELLPGLAALELDARDDLRLILATD